MNDEEVLRKIYDMIVIHDVTEPQHRKLSDSCLLHYLEGYLGACVNKERNTQ